MAAPYRIAWRPPAPIAELIDDKPRPAPQVGKHHAPHPLWRPEWPPGSVVIGQSAEGKHILLPHEMRKLGLHVVGLPNQGKSKVMEGMWRQDVLALCGTNRASIFVCPHGPSHDANLNWLISSGIDRFRTVRILDLSDPEFLFRINPAKRRPGMDPAVAGAATRDAVLRGAWGKSGQDPSAQPQTVEALDITFTTIAEFGLSFADAAKLLELDDNSGLRTYAAEHSENPLVRAFWRAVEMHKKPADREAMIGAARRRVNRLLLARRSRLVLSEPDNVMDWRRAMDEGEVVLVNLSYDGQGVTSEDQAVTLGALIMADLFLACRGRHEQSLTVQLYWDEAHRFMTEAAARLFTEARKFNLHPIFAHQFFDQLDEAGPFIKSAIMSCRNKIFFGGLPPSNAELAARFAFRGQWDFERPKHLYDKPTVIGQEIVCLRSESQSRAVAIAEGTNWSHGGSHATSRSTTYGNSDTTAAGTSASFTADGEEAGTGTSVSTATTENFADTEGVTDTENWASGGSETRTETDTRASGRNQTFKSVFKTLPTQGYAWPELLEMAAAEIAGLDQGFCIVKIGTRPAAKVRTLRIKEGWSRPEHIQRAKTKLAETTPYVVTVAQAIADEDRRSRELADRMAAARDERVLEQPPPLKDEGWN